MSGASDHCILICGTCKSAVSAQAIKDGLRGRLPEGFALRDVDCMAGCAHPRTVGFQAEGKAQYLFGPIGTEAEIAALAAFAHQYRQSADGWTRASDRPAPLLDKTLARLPAIRTGGAE